MVHIRGVGRWPSHRRQPPLSVGAGGGGGDAKGAAGDAAGAPEAVAAGDVGAEGGGGADEHAAAECDGVVVVGPEVVGVGVDVAHHHIHDLAGEKLWGEFHRVGGVLAPEHGDADALPCRPGAECAHHCRIVARLAVEHAGEDAVAPLARRGHVERGGMEGRVVLDGVEGDAVDSGRGKQC